MLRSTRPIPLARKLGDLAMGLRQVRGYSGAGA